MRLAILSWRDLTHPEGGGAERYAARIGSGLAGRGHQVTMMCADHGQAPRDEVVDGVQIHRRGGRLGVYAAGVREMRRLERRDGRFDVVVDVQNGVPFFSPLATRSPVVCLVHHVHKEQWPVVFGPLTSRAGWFVESRVAPRVYRGHQYVAVSARTKDELAGLGVDPDRIAIIHNGTEPALMVTTPRAAQPTLVVLGRLVPHKRVEHAVDLVGLLLPTFPELRLRIMGDGWWADKVRAHTERLGLTATVDQLGFVDEETKHRELAGAWVALAPSVKEGWGISVVEAASHGVPTVAYHGAGGLSESIEDGVTGLLAGTFDDLTRHVARLLGNPELRDRLGSQAREHADRFTWDGSVTSWEMLLQRTAAHAAPVAPTDPGETQQADQPLC